jgi:hypothetical protein
MANWTAIAFRFPEVFCTKNKARRVLLSEPNLSSTPEIPGTEIGARPPSTMFRLPEKTKSRHDEVICPQPLSHTSVYYLFVRLLNHRFESRDAPVSELDNNRAGLLGAAEKIM